MKYILLGLFIAVVLILGLLAWIGEEGNKNTLERM
jgi:hypothetical protein